MNKFTKMENTVYSKVICHINGNIKDQVWDKVNSQVWRQVWIQVKFQVWDQIGGEGYE